MHKPACSGRNCPGASSAFDPIWRRVSAGLLTAVLVIPLALSISPSVYAQADPVSHQFDVPAGSLESALVTFSTRTGITVSFAPDVVSGLQSAGLQGEFNADDALHRLLAGTNLQARRSDNGTYSVVEVPQSTGQSRVLVLDPVRVAGEVQGTKLSGSLQEVDVSVELLDTQRLDRERIVDVSDIFLKTANVTGNGGSNGQISIRGIARRGFTGRGSTSNIYIDGAPMSERALTTERLGVSLWDVQQAEILRGPQSTEQGRNALAGAVVISTADPTFAAEGKLRLTRSRYDTTQAAAAISGPLVKDQLAGRISIDHRETDSFVKNAVTGGYEAGGEAITSRARLLFRPAALPGLETKFTVDYFDSESGRGPVIQSGRSVADPEFFNFDFFDYENFRVPFNSEITTTRLISETGYQLDDNWSLKGIVTNEDTETDALTVSDIENPAARFFTSESDSQVTTAELRAEFDFDALRGLVGAYYFKFETEFFSNAVSPLGAGLPPFISIDPVDSARSISAADFSETENYALFGQIEWDINDHLTLSAGFRYDEEHYDDPQRDFQISVVPESCQATLPGAAIGVPLPTVTVPCSQLVPDIDLVDPAPDESFSAFLPRLGLRYRFDDSHSVFVSYQRGYRAGGSNVAVINDPDGTERIRTNLPYDPEFLDTYEVGTRNLFLQDRLLLNANVFYSKYKDQQIVITGDNPGSPFNSRIENAGKTTLYGVELLVDYTPVEAWNFYASVGILRTEFDDFSFATQGEFENLKGNELPNAPELTFTLGAGYRAESGFFASAAYSFIGEQFSDPANLDNADFRRAFADAGLDPDDGARLTEVVEKRGDLTMRIGYELGGFTFYAFARNLLDDEAVTRVNYADVNTATGTIRFRNDAGGLVSTPRSLGVGVDYTF